jgi:hypothetical protein
VKLYKLAIEPAEVGAELISSIHWHLEGIPVLFLYQDEPDVSKGKTALATARKLGPKELPLLHMAINAGADGFDSMPGFDGGLFSRTPNGYSRIDSDEETAFVITVWENAWEKLSDRQRKALIDHELCHCRIEEDERTGKAKGVIVGHDIEEFNDVVRRHGHWLTDVSNFVEACKSGQTAMQFAEPESTMTISHGGESVTVKSEDLNRLAARMTERSK